MSQPDYYQLLGVSADAPVVELEAAYRRITALFGPDANPEPFAAKIHAAATEAWWVLSDPARREAYDRLRSGTAPQGGEGWNGTNRENAPGIGNVWDTEFYEGPQDESGSFTLPCHHVIEKTVSGGAKKPLCLRLLGALWASWKDYMFPGGKDTLVRWCLLLLASTAASGRSRFDGGPLSFYEKFLLSIFFASFLVFLLLRYAIPAVNQGMGLHTVLMALLYCGACYSVVKLTYGVRHPGEFIVSFFYAGFLLFLDPD